MEYSLPRQNGVLLATPEENSMHVKRCLARGAIFMHCLTLSKDEATQELRSRDRLLPDESLDSANTWSEQLHEEGWDYVEPTRKLFHHGVHVDDLSREPGLPEGDKSRGHMEVRSCNPYFGRPPRDFTSP